MNAETIENIIYEHTDGRGYDSPVVSIGIPELARLIMAEFDARTTRADGTPRMTAAQREKLWERCGRYNVPFREDDYRPTQFNATAPIMYEGWIGGSPGTIYLGVEPDGRSHS